MLIIYYNVLLPSPRLRNSARPKHKRNRQSKINLLIPKPRKQRKKESGSGRKEVTTNTDPPTVVISLIHLTNNFMSITCHSLKAWKYDWAVKCWTLSPWFVLPSSWWKSCISEELVLLWVSFCFSVSRNIISWIFMRRNICLSSVSLLIGFQRLIKKWYVVSQSSRPLPIDWIRSSFFLSISIIASSNGRFPLLGLVLRWADDRDVSDGAGVCIELSAEEHSATKSSSILVQLSFSGSVDSRSSCLDCNCMLLSIFLAFEVLFKKSNILNHLHWDCLLLGDKPGSPDLFTFILLSSARKLSLRCFHLVFTFLPVK